MAKELKVKLYNASEFTAKHMPSSQLEYLLKGNRNLFFVVRVEEMYQLVKGPVSASRSVIHSCILITEGEAVMKIGTDEYKVGAGEVLFVPAGQVFSFGEKDRNKGFLCGFHNDFVLANSGNSEMLKEFEFMRIWANPKIVPEEASITFIESLMYRMLREYGRNGLNNPGLLQSCLHVLLQELKSAYIPLPGENGKTDSIANLFRELLVANIKEKHRVADYAAMMRISPNHLNKAVKAETGKSPIICIGESIIQEAKVLIRQSYLSLNEIASEVGIDDQSYFTRLFKRYEGVTPTVYRNLHS